MTTGRPRPAYLEIPLDLLDATGLYRPCEPLPPSNMRRYRPRSLLYPAGGGTLGYGLPAGIGAKIAEPGRPVVVLHGDGGLMFSVLAEALGCFGVEADEPTLADTLRTALHADRPTVVHLHESPAH